MQGLRENSLYIATAAILTMAVLAVSLVPTSELMAAEVVVDTTVQATNTAHVHSSPQSVCISDTQCYIFYLDSTGGLAMSSTTDGGTTWLGEAVVDSTNTTDVVNFAIWWDGWTPPGTTTQYIHIASTDSSVDDVYYIRYDIAAGTFSTPALGTTQGATCILATSPCTTSITKATDNVIYMAVADASDRWVVSCSTTCTTAGNWTERTGLTFPLGDDHVILTPVVGNNNAMLVYWDVSASALYSRVYSATSSSWQATTTIGTAGTIDGNTTYDAQLFGMAISSTTGTTTLALVDDANDYTTADHDIRFYTYTSTTDWTAKTNATTTAVGGLIGAKVAIDNSSTTAPVYYVYYGRRTTIGTNTTGNIYYVTSSNNGATWSTESAAINDNADDIYGLSSNYVSRDRLGMWWNYTTAPRDDDEYYDLMADLTPWTPPSEGGAEPTPQQGEFFFSLHSPFPDRRGTIKA